MSDGRRLVEEAFAIFEANDLERLGDVFAADCELVLPGATGHGLDEARALLRVWLDALPDVRHTISTLVEDGDAVACEVDVRGTHTGTLRTPTGDVPPAGRSVRIESATVVAIRDGKVATWRAYFDLLGFMGQLGVLPAGGP